MMSSSSRTPLHRLVYASRSTSTPEKFAIDVRAILAQATDFNFSHGITGALVAANGHYLQLLEGPRSALEDLFGRIQADPRHDEVAVLSNAPIDAATFPSWSMGLVERSEPPEATQARALVLRERLATDPSASGADFFRWMFAPSANAGTPTPGPRPDRVSRIAFASPGGMWGAAVLQHLAASSVVRPGRTHVADAQDPSNRSLLEYVDFNLPKLGPVRALSLSRDPADCTPVAPLLEQLSVLVFMLGPSDVDQFEACLHGWIDLPQVRASQPRILVLASLPPERLDALVHSVHATTGLQASSASVKRSDAAGVWATAADALRQCVAEQRALVPILHTASPLHTPTPPPPPSSPPMSPVPDAPAAEAPGSHRLRRTVLDSGCLEEMLEVEGAVQAAVLDSQSAAVVVLQCRGEGPADDAQMHGSAEFLHLKRALVERLCAEDGIEDVALTTATQFHIFRPLRTLPSLFLALTLDREVAQLATAKLKLRDVEEALGVLRH